MSFVAAGLAVAGSAIGFFSGKKAQKKAEEKERQARKELDRMKSVYSNLDTSNPYEGMENQFAGMKNQFADMENTMEDLTVNQQQAQFEAQQFQQSQANILEGMRGAAGGSGIAATVQALAGQGALQAQKSSASIGAQESKNQMATALQSGQLQMKEAEGAAAVDLQERSGAAQVDQMIAAGEQASQKMEMDKQATLLGMEQQEAAAAAQQVADAKSQKMGALSSGLSAIGGMFSDRKLKKNIKLIGNSPSGLKIYAFEYINKALGEGVFQGVMSDEMSSDVIIKHPAGYDMVDYSKLDVEFKNIS